MKCEVRCEPVIRGTRPEEGDSKLRELLTPIYDYGLDGTGIESRGARFSARPDRPCGPPSLLYNGYRVFPGGKVRSGRAADHSPPSTAVVMEEYSYTSTHPLCHNRACNGNTLPFLRPVYQTLGCHISGHDLNTEVSFFTFLFRNRF